MISRDRRAGSATGSGPWISSFLHPKENSGLRQVLGFISSEDVHVSTLHLALTYSLPSPYMRDGKILVWLRNNITWDVPVSVFRNEMVPSSVMRETDHLVSHLVEGYKKNGIRH